MLDHLKALVCFARGEREKAMALGLAGLRHCEERALIPAQLIINRFGVARMLIEGGRADQGREVLGVIESQTEFIAAWHLAGAMALLEAWAAHKVGDEARRDAYLGKAMTLARGERERHRMRQGWSRPALEELVPIALERGIETEMARSLIRDCDLSPPSHPLESWPWPVRVYTLGRFEVVVDDRPLEFGRKAPKRTIALLKAIIALGGCEVHEQRLCDALWPDLEGDAAREALAAALHRLRRLLGGSEVIRQTEGMLSLNEQRCFVDVWAFERGVELRGGQRAALRLYRGGFLQSDTEAPWSTSMRERLRGKFVRALQATARELEAVGRCEEAIDLYARGIEADDLVESLYQGLMRSYQNLGRRAEAASAYRRLRQTLSVTLGIQPAAESQRLFEELRLQ
jgi:DNA-binding SARP family transcriptional activator